MTKDVTAGSVMAGVPAVKIGETTDLDERRRSLANGSEVFSYDLYDKDHPLEAKRVAELVRSAKTHGHFFIGK